MLLKDVDVVMGRATLETRVREVCFLTGDSHPCCLHFSVKEERKLFPDLKRGDFFLSKSFRPILLWSLAAPVQQQAFGRFPVSHLSLLSLSAYGFESLLSAQYVHPAQPNGIRNTASVISQLTWRSPNV